MFFFALSVVEGQFDANNNYPGTLSFDCAAQAYGSAQDVDLYFPKCAQNALWCEREFVNPNPNCIVDRGGNGGRNWQEW